MADFFTNLRDAIHTTASSSSNLVEPKTKADEFLTVPSPIVNPTFNVPGTKRNGYQQVFGFEQDKANYGNERDGSKLNWRKLEVLNNDTGDSFQISVGYDSDGKISGVQKFTDPTHSEGYYGKELVGNFFKSNFDRDATDYTIFEKDDGDDGYKYVVFDTKNDGEFIPSQAIGSESRSFGVPANSDDLSEELRKQRLTTNTANNMLFAQPDEEKLQAAENGMIYDTEFNPHLSKLDDLKFFAQNANDFAGLMNEFSRTPDSSSRVKILQDAYKKYGSNPQFGIYLNIMASDEDAYRKGYYPDYDYTKVGNDIGNAINDVMKHYFNYS